MTRSHLCFLLLLIINPSCIHLTEAHIKRVADSSVNIHEHHTYTLATKKVIFNQIIHEEEPKSILKTIKNIQSETSHKNNRLSTTTNRLEPTNILYVEITINNGKKSTKAFQSIGTHSYRESSRSDNNNGHSMIITQTKTTATNLPSKHKKTMTPSKKEITTISHKESTSTRSERRPTATFHNKKINIVIAINKYTSESLVIRKKDTQSSNAAANMANIIQTASNSTITAVAQRATFIHNSPFKTMSVDHNKSDYLANNLHYNATNSFTQAVRVITSTENWDNSVSIDRAFSKPTPTMNRSSKHQVSTKTKEADFFNIKSNLTMHKTKMPIESDIKSTTVDHISKDKDSKTKQTDISRASASRNFQKMDKVTLTDARGSFTGSETTKTYTKTTIIYASRDTKMPKEAKNYTSSDVTTMIISTTTATISTTMVMTATATKDGNNIYTPKSIYRYHTLSWLSGDFTFSAPTSTTITTSSTILTAEPSTTDDSPEYIAPNIGVIIPGKSFRKHNAH